MLVERVVPGELVVTGDLMPNKPAKLAAVLFIALLGPACIQRNSFDTGTGGATGAGGNVIAGTGGVGTGGAPGSGGLGTGGVTGTGTGGAGIGGAAMGGMTTVDAASDPGSSADALPYRGPLPSRP